MIRLTRLNGETFLLNPDLVEKVEGHPDTVVSLVDDTKYLVRESEAEVQQEILEFRASILALAQQIAAGSYQPRDAATETGTVVPFPGS